MKYVYHGSPNGNIEELIPNKSTHMGNYVYAAESPIVALVFAVSNLGDIDFDLSIIEGKIHFTERRKDAFKKYNTSGYLYKLDASNFEYKENLWEGEVVSTKREKVLDKEFISNVYERLKEYEETSKFIIYEYPDRPDFIPKDDSDLVNKYINFEKMGHKGTLDNLLYYHPNLKDLVYSKLETPDILYYVGNSETIDKAYDNTMDALLNNYSNFIREDGFINYDVLDGKVVFEKGSFNYKDSIYIYKISGKFNRVSTHSFDVFSYNILSKELINWDDFIENKS